MNVTHWAFKPPAWAFGALQVDLLHLFILTAVPIFSPMTWFYISTCYHILYSSYKRLHILSEATSRCSEPLCRALSNSSCPLMHCSWPNVRRASHQGWRVELCKCLVMAADIRREGSTCWKSSSKIWGPETCHHFRPCSSFFFFLAAVNGSVRRRSAASSILSLSSLEVQLVISAHAQTNISKRQDLGVGCCCTAVHLRYWTCSMFLSLAAFTVTAVFFMCVFVKLYRGIL